MPPLVGAVEPRAVPAQVSASKGSMGQTWDGVDEPDHEHVRRGASHVAGEAGANIDRRPLKRRMNADLELSDKQRRA